MNEYAPHAPETDTSAYPAESPFLPRLDLPDQPFKGMFLVNQAVPAGTLQHTSGVSHPTTGISHPTTGISHPTIRISQPTTGISHPNFDVLKEDPSDRRTTARVTADRRVVSRSYASPWMVDPQGPIDPRPTHRSTLADEPIIQALDTRMPDLPIAPPSDTVPVETALIETAVTQIALAQTAPADFTAAAPAVEPAPAGPALIEPLHNIFLEQDAAGFQPQAPAAALPLAVQAAAIEPNGWYQPQGGAVLPPPEVYATQMHLGASADPGMYYAPGLTIDPSFDHAHQQLLQAYTAQPQMPAAFSPPAEPAAATPAKSTAANAAPARTPGRAMRLLQLFSVSAVSGAGIGYLLHLYMQYG